jgi:hypothetical protein
MKNSLIANISAIAAGFLLIYSCSISKDYTGTWDYTVKNTQVGDIDGTMSLHKTGEKYHGQLISDLGTTDLIDISIKKKDLHSGFNMGDFFMSLTGEFAENSFSGMIKGDAVSYPFEATRAIPGDLEGDTSQVAYITKPKPVSLIFDSDFGPDYDDVGALALLHALADQGEVEILATIASTTYPNVGPALDVVNTYFQRPDIPIAIPTINGVDRGDPQHWSDTIVANYPHDIMSNDEVESATDLYRQLLASSPDSSITIVTVGFLTNMVNLLQSEPDQHSALNGSQLITKKVKELVSMAGWFPKGREFNVFIDAKSSIYTFENWPTDVIWYSVDQ